MQSAATRASFRSGDCEADRRAPSPANLTPANESSRAHACTQAFNPQNVEDGLRLCELETLLALRQRPPLAPIASRRVVTVRDLVALRRRPVFMRRS